MQGDSDVVEDLLREVLPKLHEIAVRELKRERYIAPLSKTELIHEVWIHNLSKAGWQIHDQGHFYALASLAMRRVLIDLARKRLTARRGGASTAVSLDEAVPVKDSSMGDAAQIVEIGILMDQLDAKDPDGARMVDMYYFAGFNFEEIAQATGLSVKQVRTRYERGLKWLKRMLRGRPPSQDL